MLGVNVHQLIGDATQRVEVDGRIVDESPRLAARADFAAHDAVLAEVEFLFLENVFQRVTHHIVGSLDDALLGGIVKRLAVGAVAQQQTDGPKHDGFTRAGFTCNDIELMIRR